MRIAFVNSTHKWGGVKTWTLELAQGLKKYTDMESVILARKGPFLDRAKEMGLEAYAVNFGPDYNPLAISWFINFFKKRNISRVIVNVGKDMRTAGIAARILNIPVIHRVGLPGDMKNKLDVRLMHKWIKPRILVPCEYIKRGLLQNLPFLKPEEITVIMTGKEVRPSPPDKVNTPLQFVSTSQLNPDKGHKDVLQAFAELKREGYNFHYHVVGTGRCEQELKELARKLDLEDRVSWYGFQKDVRKILRKADVFILASYSEGLPNSLLEAMAEGLVCVARDVGGVREVLKGDFFLYKKNSHINMILKNFLKFDKDVILGMKKKYWDLFFQKLALDKKILEFESFLKD